MSNEQEELEQEGEEQEEQEQEDQELDRDNVSSPEEIAEAKDLGWVDKADFRGNWRREVEDCEGVSGARSRGASDSEEQ